MLAIPYEHYQRLLCPSELNGCSPLLVSIAGLANCMLLARPLLQKPDNDLLKHSWPSHMTSYPKRFFVLRACGSSWAIGQWSDAAMVRCCTIDVGKPAHQSVVASVRSRRTRQYEPPVTRMSIHGPQPQVCKLTNSYCLPESCNNFFPARLGARSAGVLC